MTTDAAKRAAEALNKRREAAGLRRVTVWLSSEARFKLDALKKAAGSKDKAADAAILAWVGPDDGVPFLSPADITRAVELLRPGRTVRVVDDGAVKSVPLRMPRAPFGSLAKKPKGK